MNDYVIVRDMTNIFVYNFPPISYEYFKNVVSGLRSKTQKSAKE